MKMSSEDLPMLINDNLLMIMLENYNREPVINVKQYRFHLRIMTCSLQFLQCNFSYCHSTR